MTEHQANATDSRNPGPYTTANASTHKSRWWIWLIVAALILAGVVWWQRRGASPQAKTAADPTSRPVLISTATAHQGDIDVP